MQMMFASSSFKKQIKKCYMCHHCLHYYEILDCLTGLSVGWRKGHTTEAGNLHTRKKPHSGLVYVSNVAMYMCSF